MSPRTVVTSVVLVAAAAWFAVTFYRLSPAPSRGAEEVSSPEAPPSVPEAPSSPTASRVRIAAGDGGNRELASEVATDEGLFDRALERLRSLEPQPDFHRLAPPLIEDIAALVRPRPRERDRERLRAFALGDEPSPRVRGALLVALAASTPSHDAEIGLIAPRLDLDPEVRRAACLAVGKGDGPSSGLPIRVGPFFAHREGFSTYDFLLARGPLDPGAKRSLLQLASQEDERTVRECACLALGPLLEKDAEVRDFFLGVLRRPEVVLAPIRSVTAYVLSRSKHPEIAEAIRRFVEEEGSDFLTRAQLLFYLPDAGGDPQLDLLVRSARDARRIPGERNAALIALMKEAPRVTEGSEALRISATLVASALEDEASTVRLTALASLEASGRDPAAAEYAAREVLARDPDPLLRGFAAKVLGRVPENSREAALGTLRARFGDETDASVRSALLAALARSGDRQVLAFVRAAGLSDPSPEVVAAAEKALAEARGPQPTGGTPTPK